MKKIGSAKEKKKGENQKADEKYYLSSMCGAIRHKKECSYFTFVFIKLFLPGTWAIENKNTLKKKE